MDNFFKALKLRFSKIIRRILRRKPLELEQTLSKWELVPYDFSKVDWFLQKPK